MQLSARPVPRLPIRLLGSAFRAMIALLALLAWLGPPPLCSAPVPPDTIPGEIIIKLRSGIQLTAAARVRRGGAPSLGQLLRRAGAGAAQLVGADSATYRVRIGRGRDPAATASGLSADPAVVFAEPNYQRRVLRVPNDPAFERQWALPAIRAPEAWDTTTGDAIVIAILDTGVSPTHLDLKRKLLPGADLFGGDADPRDDEGHGTMMAGIAAADSDNGAGVAGVCWGCTILPVKVLSRRGVGDDATIAAGIRYAVDHGARIISMSLGGPNDSAVLREAVAYAAERNVLIVAASGNEPGMATPRSYPAAYPSVLAVGAITSKDQPAPFSTGGDYVKISAPGVGVWSTLWQRLVGDTYGPIDGTSAATPQVAGAAALVLSARPDLTAAQAAEVLQIAATDLGPPGRDNATGYGRLDVARAVALAREPDLLARSVVHGVVSGTPPGEVTVRLNGEWAVQPDDNGVYRFEGLSPGDYKVEASGPDGRVLARQARLTGTALSVAAIDFRFGVTAADAFQPVADPDDPAVAYFAATGHTLRGTFLDYWRANGGLAVFGYPISEELTEPGDDGRTYLVQYFERHRLEWHPENRPPYHVLLTRIGDRVLQQTRRDWFLFPKGAQQPGCLYFEATGHSLCEPFLTAWRSNGLDLDGRTGTTFAESLALFGQPLSEPQLEPMADGVPRVVQWFERARFERHGSNSVLLGLLGNELVGRR